MKTTETPTPARRRSPIFWVPTAYFGMGLPFVVLNMVAVLMYKGLGVSDAKIAFWTSLIMLPWTLKPLWSPLLEMYRTKKFFVVLTQLLSGCLFGLVALALNLPCRFIFRPFLQSLSPCSPLSPLAGQRTMWPVTGYIWTS